MELDDWLWSPLRGTVKRKGRTGEGEVKVEKLFGVDAK